MRLRLQLLRLPTRCQPQQFPPVAVAVAVAAMMTTVAVMVHLSRQQLFHRQQFHRQQFRLQQCHDLWLPHQL
jgi:hypothetical protein